MKREIQSDKVDIITVDDEDDITEVQKTPQKRKRSTLTISINDNDDIIISKPLNKTPRKGSPPREATVIIKSTSKTSAPKKQNSRRKIFDDEENYVKFIIWQILGKMYYKLLENARFTGIF